MKEKGKQSPCKLLSRSLQFVSWICRSVRATKSILWCFQLGLACLRSFMFILGGVGSDEILLSRWLEVPILIGLIQLVGGRCLRRHIKHMREHHVSWPTFLSDPLLLTKLYPYVNSYLNKNILPSINFISLLKSFQILSLFTHLLI